MVSSKGGSELSVGGLKLGRDEYATHGEAVANAFGYGNDVGTDAQPLVGKKLSATSVSALYLIANECGSVFPAGCQQPLGKFGSGKVNASHALNTFDDAGTHVTLCQFGFPCSQVVEWKIGGVLVGVDRSDNLGIVGGFHCQRRSAMESFLGRQNAGAPIMERSQL